MYLVFNSTAQTLTVKTSAGTGATVAASANRLVYCDGTNIVEPGVTGTGDVVGPASAVDNALMVADGVTGKLAKTGEVRSVTDTIQGKADNTGRLAMYAGGSTGGAGIESYGSSHATLANISDFVNGAGVKRMRIAANGNVLIGTTTDNGYKVNVTGEIFTSGVNRFDAGWVTKVSANVRIGTATEDSISTTYDSIEIQAGSHRNLFLSKPAGYTATSFVAFFVAGSEVGAITTNGTATYYTTTSDYRLKCDWKPIESPIEMIGRLPVYDGEFKTKPGYRVHYGIAHEWQAVLPWAVTGEKDGEEMQAVDYSKAVPLLIAAVQELSKQVAELKSQIGAK